ncbi:MAG: sulfotransferase family 2 domain-containing protein [Paracoccaceae bacterium]|nr:MAG: sulfotransferase family 2 domain-containing protein [Paracoccaceae bacterium]
MTVVGTGFLFIHVPKAAGQSLSARLGGVSRTLPGHAPLWWIDPAIRKDRFAFGFVRNPWDRLVSLYAFQSTKTVKNGESAEYQAFIRSIGFTRWLLEDRMFMPQDAAWMAPDLPPMQQRSQMWWVDGCDFVGNVETLDADFAGIAPRLALRRGWREVLGLRPRMAHRNRSARAGYRDYYDAGTTAFVARHFAPEIERFGYRF